MVQFECPRAILIPFTFGVYYEVPGESLPEHARRVQARGTEFNTAAIKWMKVVATAMGKAATGGLGAAREMGRDTRSGPQR